MVAWDSASLKSLDDENEVHRVKKQAKEYASETSIHGIKYICQDGRPHYEG